MTMTTAPVGFAPVHFLLRLHDEGFLLFWCTDYNKAKKRADVYGFTGETRGLDKLIGDGMKEQKIYTGWKRTGKKEGKKKHKQNALVLVQNIV